MARPHMRSGPAAAKRRRPAPAEIRCRQREILDASCDYNPLDELPVAPREATRVGRAALRTAARLLDEHQAEPRADPAKALLRAAGALVWLAHLSACQAVVLRRTDRDTPSGTTKDIEDATALARSPAERAVADVASDAEHALLVQGLQRGKLSATRVATWITLARAAVRDAERSSERRRGTASRTRT